MVSKQKKDIIFKPGFNLYIGEGYVKEEIVTYRSHKDFDMVTFNGYDNINQVLNYLKMNVYVKRSDLELSKDEYILDDLIGLSIQENGEMLGKVEEIVYNGINILLSVVGNNNFYIPTNGNFIKKVDLERGLILDSQNNIMHINNNDGVYSIIKKENEEKTSDVNKKNENSFQKILTPSNNTIYSNNF